MKKSTKKLHLACLCLDNRVEGQSACTKCQAQWDKDNTTSQEKSGWVEKFYSRYTDRHVQPHKPLTCNIIALPYEIESFIRAAIASERASIARELTEKITQLADEFPVRESDEFDQGRKSMKKECLALINPKQ
jgi:hypothetical protein